MDERADEKRALREAQSLPLNPDGTLNIAGFHLRDAAHRKLAVEHLREIVTSVLPSAEVVAKRRYDVAEAMQQQQQQQGGDASGDTPPVIGVNVDNGSFSGTGSFGDFASLSGALSVSPNAQRRDSGTTTAAAGGAGDNTSSSAAMRTRTRTVKLNVSALRTNSVQEAADQVRPFISQLLLYPECADEVLRSLGDLFVKFVRACASVSDAAATVVVFVRWLCALTLRFAVGDCLRACDAVLDLQRIAAEMKRTAAVRPAEIAAAILGDITRHLEDESEWYPAARICLCRLYLNAPAASALPALLPDNASMAVDNNSNVARPGSAAATERPRSASTRASSIGSAGAGGGRAPAPLSESQDENAEVDATAASYKDYEGNPSAVAAMVTEDGSVAVRTTALGELTRWIDNSDSSKVDLVERARMCLGAVQELQAQGTGDAEASPSMWVHSDALRYSCIPLVLAVCDKLHFAGRAHNADALGLLRDAAEFALRFAADPSWRVRYRLAAVVHRFVEFHHGGGCGNNAAAWVAAAGRLSVDEEPTIRAAIAGRADVIFFDHQHASGSDNDDNALAIMISLAEDPDTDVRCAVVPSFFRTWAKMASGGSATSSRNAAAVFHALLSDSAESVRIAALGALGTLSGPRGLLSAESRVLAEAVQAVVAAVGGGNVAAAKEQEKAEPKAAADSIEFGFGGEDIGGGGGMNMMMMAMAEAAGVAAAASAAAPPPPALQAQTAGKWQTRRLGAEQLPLLAEHMPLTEFRWDLWPCLGRLLTDPTAAVREHVVTAVLPSVAATYGPRCALDAVNEFVLPLVAHRSYKERRSGFLALASTARAVFDDARASVVVVDAQSSGDDDAAAKAELQQLVRATVAKMKGDAVALVREAVETELGRNDVLQRIMAV